MAGLPNLPDWLTTRPYLTGDFVKSLDLPTPVSVLFGFDSHSGNSLCDICHSIPGCFIEHTSSEDARNCCY